MNTTILAVTLVLSLSQPPQTAWMKLNRAVTQFKENHCGVVMYHWVRDGKAYFHLTCRGKQT